MTSNGFAIQVEHTTKRFGEFTAVQDVSFHVKPGEIFGLLGPNGAGKSTLIRMMTTLMSLTSGDIFVGGFDVRRNADEVRRRIGVIPQAMTSDLDLTAEENLLMYAKLYGVGAPERTRRIEHLLDAVGLTEWRNTLVKNFSGGMRRRLEIARGLVHRPAIFFLDEPTTGLDPASRQHTWDMIRNLQAESNLTVLLTTHYMEEADRLCDRIAIIDHGKLVALDTPSNLKSAVSGSDIVEARLGALPTDCLERLKHLKGVRELEIQDHTIRLSSDDGARTARDLVEFAYQNQLEVVSIAVQKTTLDDVFLHYTGRALRDSTEQNVLDHINLIYR